MAFDFDAAVSAPFRMQPGLRRLAPGARHLTPLAAGSRHQCEKLAVLSGFASDALLRRPGFDAGPALDALCVHAAAEHPEAFAWDGQLATARRFGVAVHGEHVERVDDGRVGPGEAIEHCLKLLPPPWRRAGLLSLAFAEDFAIVDGDDASLPWLAVALPSHWAPEEKIGRGFAAVHAPVADNRLIVQAAEGLTRLVTDGGARERFVWNVTPHPRLNAHPRRVAPDAWRHTPVERAGWRTERQTFLPVPGRCQAVFTIEVQLQPLAEALAEPGRAARLHAAIASMSPAVLAYRGLAGVREPLLAWLSRHA
ncbi:heme-dependent oxidative N-demethylase subunit alpha family protein [Rubrivivax gelatinosus]|uniref:Uncharacterized protein DUF3445 n=1 Tax=Rubrivivax gelatinosus TaxID=28068 RepID=A0A4R2M939_RUBGE|nr:heme-dependent oxidative N-demethylase subunit alpha family protein [Rubrivivax gelatinosus]MBK1686813.1 hypothetical protein [Rubrivivax gelatinosus]TCP01485.1 uncharacterized protein DUF3445 [Rubrivivax gelatinosus]